MPKNPQEFADLLGAKVVGEVPEVGAGPFGMARLAHLMHRRLTPSRGERPGRPTDSTWASRPKVPMSEGTQRRLAEIAAAISTAERRVSPMQVAAQLLEEAVKRVPVNAEPPREGDGSGPSNLPASGGGKAEPKTNRQGETDTPGARDTPEGEKRTQRKTEGSRRKARVGRRKNG